MRFLLPLAALVIAIILPILYTDNYYIQLFSQSLINIIAVIGLNIVMGMAGQSNLGTIGLMAIGAYVASLLASATGSTNLLAVLAVLVVAIILGLMLGYPSLRVNGIYLSLTTMSFAQIVFTLANNMTWLTGGAMGVYGYDLPNLFGWQVTSQTQMYYVVLVVTALFLIMSSRMAKSKYGRAMKAVRDNTEAVESIGLSITKLKLMAFLIATILGCIAGLFYAWVMQYVAPTTFTTDNGVRYVVAMMLGGIGSTAGAAIGAILVTCLPELLRFLGNYYQLVFYGLSLVLLLVCPRGLSHLFTLLKEKVVKLAQTKMAKTAGKEP